VRSESVESLGGMESDSGLGAGIYDTPRFGVWKIMAGFASEQDRRVV